LVMIIFQREYIHFYQQVRCKAAARFTPACDRSLNR
jgi:hypothetical protein